MRHMPPRSTGLAAGLLSVLMTACGGTTTPTSGAQSGNPYASTFNPTTVNWLSGNQNAGGRPVTGGTLKLVGNGDVDHLDTANIYTIFGYTLERAFARQLYSYPADTDLNRAMVPVPDAAAAMPTVSSDGKTYTVKLRAGVMWNTSPSRAVTSKDFLFGFKRLCNPVSPTGAPQYFTATIAGFSDYCTAFGSVGSDLASVKRYMAAHEIPGIATPDDTTIVFTLKEPASDFVNILATPFASAAPQEYNDYLPDSAELHSHLLSDGPYTIVKYVPTQEIDLDKNPAWSQNGDPLRHQYLDRIVVTEGQTEQGVQQQIQAGAADLQWDTTVPTDSLRGLEQPSRDSRLGIFPSPDVFPFVSFNLQSPNSGKATQNIRVRQALEYAVDKAAINKIFGGAELAQPLNQVVPPGQVGYQPLDRYPVPGNIGDPATCKRLLNQAGISRLTLKFLYPTTGKYADVFQQIQTDFSKCGVTVVGVPVTYSDFFANYLMNPAAGKSGVWDIASAAWVPDWYGNNGRAIIEPLFDGRSYGPGSPDFGDYNSAAVNGLIDKALAATSATDAATFWHQADEQLMADAALIPLQTQFAPIFHSSRVHNAIFLPTSVQYDITQIWLSS